MKDYRRVAMLSVGKAVFFGSFMIALVMMSFAFDLSLAADAGALLSLAMAAILLWQAETLNSRNPRHFEAWLLLPEEERPRNPSAVRVFQKNMCDALLFYSTRSFGTGLCLLFLGIPLDLFGIEIGLQ